jgi:hypothetical protein
MSFDFGQLTGPLGGILALSWGSGAVMGYAFASRTIGKRVDELKGDIRDLTMRLREVEDRTYNGMERQLAQTRQSTAVILDRGGISNIAPTATEAANRQDFGGRL